MDNKAELRKDLKQQRALLSAKVQRSADICQHLETFIAKVKPKQIFAYLSFRDEPNLDPMLDRLSEKGFRVGLPKISQKTGTMDFYKWHKGQLLSVNSLGIREPQAWEAAIIPKPNDLMILPALGVDFTGVRLGYGGGFYDRYLANFKISLRIAVVFADCYYAGYQLPAERHDTRVSHVCHEKGILACTDS